MVCVALSFLLPLVGVAGTWALPVSRTARISVDGRTFAYTSFRPTVGDVVAANKITLRDGDRVTPSLNTLIWPGIQISVLRAVPVILTVRGHVRTERVAARTVGEALEALEIPVGSLDRIYPDPSTAIVPQMRITVERRGWRTWVERRPIPTSTVFVRDAEVFRGNELVRAPGHEGVEERTMRVLYADGRPSSVTAVAWTQVQRPAPRIVAVGTRPMIAERGKFAGREFMIMEATAYYPGPKNYGGGVGTRTKNGMLAQRGVVAVDPRVIPLGSHLYIDGYGYAIAADIGGMIKGQRIDLCYNTYEEAIQFGRRPVKVYLLEKP